MRRFVLALLLAGGVFAGGASASTFDVHVGPNNSLSFSPSILTVQPGDTVHWVWDTGTPHSTTSDSPGWDSGVHIAGFTFDQIFNSQGTFPYRCSVHGPLMTGQIMVGPPTAVRFVSFGVARTARGVVVRWGTGTEASTLGFDVFRQGYGDRVRVNRTLIAARGGVSGHSYSFVDARAPQLAIPVRYSLRVRTLGGIATWYGPQLLAPPAVSDWARIFSS